MKADTVCLRCHQKCVLTAEVIDGKVVSVVDASPINRMPPCSEACPIGMDIPGYVNSVSQGKFKEAVEIIRDTNPFPSVTGRVCHHPCELECRRIAIDEPVAIEWVKRLAVDYSLKSGEKPAPVKRTKKEEIAIIGSGPAGLTAAHDLVKAGYGVTVYEAAPVAGGILATAIPEFRLPQATVQADIDYITALGVQIKANTPIGKSLTIDSLLQKYNAVLVSVGCQKSATLAIPGSDLNGIYHALPFLKDIKQGKEIRLGGKVIIIGGGNEAIDSARCALRLGVEEVSIIYRRSEKEMPALPEEVEKAGSEGIQFKFLTDPKRFLGDGHNQVMGIECYKMELGELDETGRPHPVAIPNSEHSIDADTVIVAIGQTADISSLGEDSKLKVTSRGTVVVNPETLATDIPGLFAAGDVVVGAGTVVDSIAAGRKAASSIIKYLGGS